MALDLNKLVDELVDAIKPKIENEVKQRLIDEFLGETEAPVAKATPKKKVVKKPEPVAEEPVAEEPINKPAPKRPPLPPKPSQLKQP